MLRFTIDWCLGLTLCAAACAFSCQGASSSQSQTAEAQSAVPPKPGTPAQNLVQGYLTLQAKLAADDQAGAHAAFGTVRSALSDKDLTIEPGLYKRMEQAIGEGASASKLPATRAAFANLSDAMLSLYANVESPLSEPLSVAFCPMARDGKGGKWLQRGTEIRNPYYGSEMLTCGSVENTLKPGKKL
jgi:Cu(I)/Ag(I) efflux system membrane fusion protein